MAGDPLDGIVVVLDDRLHVAGPEVGRPRFTHITSGRRDYSYQPFEHPVVRRGKGDIARMMINRPFVAAA